VERLEDNVTLPASCGDAPVAEPALHGASDAGVELARLLKAHDRPPLVELFRTEVVRERRVIQSHGATIEWALDRGSVRSGERVRPLLELELELVAGHAHGLYATAQDWQARHGLWIDPISKAERGALLLGGRQVAPPVKADVPVLHREMDIVSLTRAVVAACLSQVLPNSAELAAGSRDPEHVHQLRVGLRRLRTALRELAQGARGLDPAWEVAVRAVFDALGEVRDRYVQGSTLVRALEQAGAPLADPDRAVGVDPTDEGACTDRARDLVRAVPFQRALLALLSFSQNALPPVSTGESPGASARTETEPALQLVHARLDLLHRQVVRHADEFEGLSFEAQHKVRKRLKRLRYLSQFVSTLFKARRVEVWLNALEPAQDALGDYVDRATAAMRFAGLADRDPRAWFAAGWLRGRLSESARDARKGLERFARAAPFW